MADPLFQSTLLLYLYTLPLAILCSVSAAIPIFLSTAGLKSSDSNSPLASVQLTLFRLELLGECLSCQREKGEPISWNLISSHWEAASKRQQK